MFFLQACTFLTLMTNRSRYVDRRSYQVWESSWVIFYLFFERKIDPADVLIRQSHRCVAVKAADKVTAFSFFFPRSLL